MRPVAVTAIGVACGYGLGLQALARGLRAGGPAVAPLPGLPGALASRVREVDADLADFPDDRKVALLAACLPDVSAPVAAPPERRAVFLGTGLSSVTPRELAEDVYPLVRDGRVDREAAMADLARDRVAPRRHLPERATAWLRERVGARGPSGTTFSACAAAAEAIGAAARAVARGEADVAWAGGHDSMLHPLGWLSFEALGALSPSACRPFDRRRDGFAMGEGAAILRLERAETLTAEPLAWILGAGSSLDASGLTAPHPEGAGAEAAMRRALRDAGLDPDAIGWVNAHGTGTPLGDAAEAAAIARIFGAEVPVSSVKGALGHTLAAAGAIEAAVSVVALREGFIPGTVGCEEPAPLGVNVLTRSVAQELRYCVSNSFGFGGQNACLVFERGGG